jgi:hypothetical protein
MSGITGVDFPMSFGIIPEIYMDKGFIHGNKMHRL